MNSTPISITLYGENDEPIAEYQKTVIPWNMLKRALRFRDLGEGGIDERAFDSLGGFVCELFGNRFTLEELGAGADISEVFAVIQAVVTRAAGYFTPNSQAGR